MNEYYSTNSPSLDRTPAKKGEFVQVQGRISRGVVQGKYPFPLMCNQSCSKL